MSDSGDVSLLVRGMGVATYGEHAERAALALNRLLQEDAIPVDPGEVDQLLYCRQAVIDALRQRLHALGLDAPVRVQDLPAPSPGANLEGIDFKLATLLANIAFSTPFRPRPGEDQQVGQELSPVDILGAASTNTVTELWRQAAVEMLTASHVLDVASDKPWLRDYGAGWFVLRDCAVTLEAVLVLDARLDEVGLLSHYDAPAYPMGLEEKRLVASQAARVATWHATSDEPDHVTARTHVGSRTRVAHPVVLVSAPEDLAAAQQRLASFLRPLDPNDTAFTGEPEISADSARQITASQLLLCRAFAAMSRRTASTTRIGDFFDQRAEVLTALQPQLRYLVDIEAGEPNMRRFWQQGELTSALIRMQDTGTHLQLVPRQVLELANATHDVTHHLGICLRRELMRADSNLRDANPRHDDGPVRVGRHSRLEVTVTDLVHTPAPNIPVATCSVPVQRAALRQALDMTSTSARPPAPYPAIQDTTFEPLSP